MKLTRQNMHDLIDSYSPLTSDEDVFIDVVNTILKLYPQILPRLCVRLGYTIEAVMSNQLHTLYIANERASYLESYLSGNMYPEEIAKKPEYIDIQRGHATVIKERTAQALGEYK